MTEDAKQELMKLRTRIIQQRVALSDRLERLDGKKDRFEYPYHLGFLRGIEEVLWQIQERLGIDDMGMPISEGQ